MSAQVLVVDPAVAPSAPRRSVLRRLLRDPQAVISGAIIAIMVVAAVLAPFVAAHDENHASLPMINAPIGSPDYLLGGDQSGRDILSRLLFSIGTALQAGLIGVSVALLVGVTAGLIGGYFGRVASSTTEWVFSLIMAFPGLLLLIILMPVTGGDFRITMVIFGVLLSPSIYRIVRNMVLGVKHELYVDAAKVSGLSDLRILGRHVLFAVRGPVIIAAAFLMSTAINVQSGLAFLGVGSNRTASFGAMIADAFLNLYAEPLQIVWPSVMLGLLTASFVLLGNALRDALEGARPKPARLTQLASTTRSAPAQAASDAVIDIRDLAIAYPTPGGGAKVVVEEVSLTVRKGETLGLVGESGSGKTQTAFAALGVLPPEAKIVGGAISVAGTEVVGLPEHRMRELRGRVVAYIPQEPMSNLDPSFTVGSQLVEGIRAAHSMSKKAARKKVLSLLQRVGIPDPDRTFNSYPHQISGGMAQRVLIAGAVASEPEVLIADEPTTALDVTVQAEILDLLRDLQEEFQMGLLIVTHNFGVVADICDRIAVMKSGRIVEAGNTLEVFRDPQHEYTKMLLDSILDEDTVRSDPPAVVNGASL